MKELHEMSDEELRSELRDIQQLLENPIHQQLALERKQLREDSIRALCEIPVVDISGVILVLDQRTVIKYLTTDLSTIPDRHDELMLELDRRERSPNHQQQQQEQVKDELDL